MSNSEKPEKRKRGLKGWLSSIPGGLTLAAPFVDRLALDGLVTRALLGVRELTREFWRLVEIPLWFQIPQIWKDTLTISALLIFPAIFQFIWSGKLDPATSNRLFESKDGLFKNESARRYLALAFSFLAMVVFLNGTNFPVALYLTGAIIIGFSSVVAWKAPVKIVVWAICMLSVAYFEDYVRPVIENYFNGLGI
ncbi:MAG: hypothetical protein AAFR51_17135 [Pseudomonadota bacterium]